MPLYPMGFHITWGTYGARLHRSPKPLVERDPNEYGAPHAATRYFFFERSRTPSTTIILSIALHIS